MLRMAETGWRQSRLKARTRPYDQAAHFLHDNLDKVKAIDILPFASLYLTLIDDSVV